MTHPDWIAADWGTTHLRLWAMQGDTVLDRCQTTDGMGTLGRDQFAPALDRAVTQWSLAPGTTVVACGMVGARQGWAEAPYRKAPCTPHGTDAARAPHPTLDIRILPGVRQDTPADVMRGEETQIAGFMALNPGWDGVICLPGTHTKWVEISAGEIVSFQTFLTGELFALLSTQSVLRHSVGAEGWDAEAFRDALSETISRPERLAARFFGLRASDLLHAQSQAISRARLSGLLIGAELAATRPYWLGRMIAVIGSEATSAPYTQALEAQGLSVTRTDAERMTLAGLTAAWRMLKGQP